MSLFEKFKKSFSINLKPVDCPDCGTPQPLQRKPKNIREVLWGGGTCPECGCEMDRRGAKI